MKRTIHVALFAALVFAFTIVINVFRQELFGIIPGNASHNFGFNIIFFIPSNLLTLVISIWVIIRVLINWKAWKNLKQKIICLGCTLPIASIWAIQILRIMQNN